LLLDFFQEVSTYSKQQMIFPGTKSLFILLSCFLLSYFRAGACYDCNSGLAANCGRWLGSQDTPDMGTMPAGYKAIVPFDDGFISAGSEGQIDLISASGEVVKWENIPGKNFNCLLAENQKVIVAGNNGTMLISINQGAFRQVDSGTNNNINALVLFKGIIVAGTSNGEILTGDGTGPFSIIYPEIKGNIVSLSARTNDCYGVTDKGEIIHSGDGTNWDVFDFNQVYAGYYKPCIFKYILATGKRLAVAGVYNDGSPVLMFSNQGNVWSERTLNYSDDQGRQYFLNDTPNAIYYNNSLDLFFLACNNGIVMKIPSCSHCNTIAKLTSVNLSGISGDNKTLIVVGDHFYTTAINAE
jgi:hypothetical protein